MDFNTLVNRENFKAILHHHLKRQVQAKFENSVSKDIQAQLENEPALSDNAINSVSNSISESDEYKELLRNFLHSIAHLFGDKEKYIPKEDNQGTVSQCSSASSVNTSIDYISFDKFQDIISALTNGVNAEKLEALETFSRLPSLDHIIKKTLWSSIENGLHDALLSDVSLLKDASLKVYTKMLSSSESKVVQESFSSLIKYMTHIVLPSMDQNTVDFIRKCKLVVEIIAMLNKFLQNIPSHWLRYPQPVIEDISVQSLSILSYGSRNSNVFPVWLCVALCDKKSKWLKSILYGHVSRAYFLDALLKDPYIIKYVFQFCENFNSDDNHVPLNNECCQNFPEIIHVICFLSHLLQYSQGTEIFNSAFAGESFSWINALDLVMKCTVKLCSVSCFNCCSVASNVVSRIWHPIWSNDNISTCYDSLITILIFKDIENLSINSICFIIQCLCHVSYDFSSFGGLQEFEDMVYDFICVLLKYITNFPFNFPNVSSEGLIFLNTSILFVKKIISSPSELFINLLFMRTFFNLCLKISNISKELASKYSPGMKGNLVSEAEQKMSNLFIAMLQKPSTILMLHNSELFEISVNILLEKILNDIKLKNSVCLHDVSILSVALNTTYFTKSILNKSIIFKLSSVIWELDGSNLENLPRVKSILEIIIPSIFPNNFESEILLDSATEKSITLFQHVILFPCFTNQEFFLFEEYSTLALEIISLLTCSILSSCYLQAKYKLSNLLFELQSYSTNKNDIVIIDSLSVLQNHILVKLYAVGGFRERVLPPETLLSDSEEYDWPFFMEYPVPDVYYHKLHDAVEAATSVNLDTENLKDIIFEYSDLDLLTIDLVSQILLSSVNAMDATPALAKSLNFVTLDNVDHLVLSDEILVGLEMTVRYGVMLNLINEDENVLKQLFKAGKCLLNSENGFQLDLFISTVCLIFKGDRDKSWLFLEAFAKTPTSFFIWYERMLQATEQNRMYVSIFNIIMEHCDIIVKQTLPLVYSAFQLSKVLPSILFKYWTMHCYWNYLEFSEVAHFVLISVVFGGDFAVYFFVSVLKHIQSLIVQNAHCLNLINILKCVSIQDYKLNNYMHFIIELSNIFECKISKSITDVLGE